MPKLPETAENWQSCTKRGRPPWRHMLIFDRIRLNFSVAIETIKTNVLLSLGNRVREYTK